MNIKPIILSLLIANSGLLSANPAINKPNHNLGDLIPNGHYVGGFYPNWSYWRGTPSVKKIQMVSGEHPSFLTYAFLSIKNSNDMPNNETYGGLTYGKAGVTNLKNGTVYDLDQMAERNINDKIQNYLRQYSQQNNFPIIASIGGWSFAKQFNSFYKDAKSAGSISPDNPVIKTFVDSALSYVEKNNIDGINIDWEYPGFTLGNEDQDVKGEGKFFTFLIKQLRKKFGNKYILTVAVWSDSNKNKITADGSINWGNIAQYVNWIDLMSFDQNGEFNIAPNQSGKAQSMASIGDINEALDLYINDQKVPSKKILLGLPAYAREMIVTNAPTKTNDFGYNGNLRYLNYDTVFKCFSSVYYEPGSTYNYAYNANAKPYYPIGGMVDFTGVYSYSCFINLISDQKVSGFCPINFQKIDNRGNIGTQLPQSLRLAKLSDHSVGWMYSDLYNAVPMKFSQAPFSSYPGYAVFTFDTPETVIYKINNIVKKRKLGGAWFWAFTQDSLSSENNAKYSLFHSVYKALHTNIIPWSKLTPAKHTHTVPWSKLTPAKHTHTVPWSKLTPAKPVKKGYHIYIEGNIQYYLVSKNGGITPKSWFIKYDLGLRNIFKDPVVINAWNDGYDLSKSVSCPLPKNNEKDIFYKVSGTWASVKCNIQATHAVRHGRPNAEADSRR